MTPEERQKLHEEITEALKNCPQGHLVMLGHDGMPSTVRYYPMPPKP